MSKYIILSVKTDDDSFVSSLRLPVDGVGEEGRVELVKQWLEMMNAALRVASPQVSVMKPAMSKEERELHDQIDEVQVLIREAEKGGISTDVFVLRDHLAGLLSKLAKYEDTKPNRPRE